MMRITTWPSIAAAISSGYSIAWLVWDMAVSALL